MFTESFFKEHHDHYTGSDDRWMRTLMRLHVASNFKNERDFKIEAAYTLRKSNVYKVTKLNPDLIEDNLINNQKLSVTAFCVLAHFLQINVAVQLGHVYFVVGKGSPSATHYVDSSGQIRLLPSSSFNELFRIQSVGKPLNALSYYSAADLEKICSVLRIPSGSKPYMYNGIQSYIQQKLTAS
jgi:hypothetical protein